MRNNPGTYSKPNRRDPRLARAAMWARLGYLDALAGAPYSREYECAPRQDQVNYESGRLWAVSCRRAQVSPPAWPERTLLPRTLQTLVERVCNLDGAPSVPMAA